jgi:hypothetical protein
LNNNYKIVFVQAPADLPFLLNLIELNRNDYKIFVLNVKGIYDFLTKIGFKSLVYIDYIKFDIRNPYSILTTKYKLRNLVNKNFKSVENIDVYFFSRFEDWITSSFIHYLQVNKKCNIYYINHYDFSSNYFERKPNFKKFILQIIYKFITNVKFNFDIEAKSPEFPISKYNLVEVNPNLEIKILERYLHKLNINKYKKNIIYFISPISNNNYEENSYLKTYISIIKFLNKHEFNVLIKGHPRVGLPIINDKSLIFEVIDSKIPAEFLNYENIDACIGVDTTSLGFISKYIKIPCYSYIELLKINDKKVVYSLQKYLNKYSDNTLINLNKKNLKQEFEKFKKLYE